MGLASDDCFNDAKGGGPVSVDGFESISADDAMASGYISGARSVACGNRGCGTRIFLAAMAMQVPSTWGYGEGRGKLQLLG